MFRGRFFGPRLPASRFAGRAEKSLFGPAPLFFFIDLSAQFG